MRGVVLPGLGFVGVGVLPVRVYLEFPPTAEGCWVATRVRSRYSP